MAFLYSSKSVQKLSEAPLPPLKSNIIMLLFLLTYGNYRLIMNPIGSKFKLLEMYILLSIRGPPQTFLNRRRFASCCGKILLPPSFSIRWHIQPRPPHHPHVKTRNFQLTTSNGLFCFRGTPGLGPLHQSHSKFGSIRCPETPAATVMAVS